MRSAFLMYHWASASLLISLQACVLIAQHIQRLYRRWIPKLHKKVHQQTGIRPSAPRCLAIVVADADANTRDLSKLRTVCKWCGSVGIEQILVYDAVGSVNQAGGLGLKSDGGTSDLSGVAVTVLDQHDALPHLLAAVDSSISGNHASQRELLTPRDLAIPDPDLMLVFGTAFTLAGFPPWALRATEMYHMKRLKHVTEASLQQTLQCYNNTAQRFGA